MIEHEENKGYAVSAGDGSAVRDPDGVPFPTRGSICLVLEQGYLDERGWAEALAFAGYAPGEREWSLYWRHVLLLCGALFLTAGILFFIAWNWDGMHRFARLALVEGVVLAAGLLAVWRGPDSFGGGGGGVSLLACGIAVGPMLAVFGQTYQTGAQLWELFRVWAVFLVLLAAVGRQAALWLAAWVVANLFVMLWMGRTMDSPLDAIGVFATVPESVLVLVLGFAGWELAAYATRGNARYEWLQARWLPRLLFLDITVRLTLYLVRLIFARAWFFHEAHTTFLLPSRPLLPLLAVVVAAGSLYWHRKRTPDLFMPACVLASGGVLLVSLMLRAKLFFDADIAGVFLWGCIILGITLAIAKLLHVMQREMETNADTSPGAPGRARMFFMRFGTRRTWGDVWDHLVNTGCVPADSAVPAALIPVADGSPWYVRALLAFGGWVAAVLFLAFVILTLFLSMGIRSNEGIILIAVSLCVLAAGCPIVRLRGLFARHFGLALALAGAMGVSIGLRLLADGLPGWRLYVALFLGVSIVPVQSAVYRFLAAAGTVALAPMGFLGSIVYRAFMRDGVVPVALQGVAWAWWMCVAVLYACLWLRESSWRRDRRLASSVPPVLHGMYAGMAAYGIYMLSLSFAFSPGAVDLPVYLDPLGGGCACGLAYMAWKLAGKSGLPGTRRRTTLRWLAPGCAVAVIPLGIFLPGVSLALLGLAMGRLLSDRVMQGAAGTILFTYMVYYYYALHVTLLHKSLFLVASGVLLLAIAWLWKAIPGADHGASGMEAGHA